MAQLDPSSSPRQTSKTEPNRTQPSSCPVNALVRTDAAAARVLAGGADQDVSAFGAKLDAHTRALNVLRETQLQLREVQLEQGVAIGVLGQRVDGLESEMRKGFAMTAAGMARIIALLEDIAGSPQDQAMSDHEAAQLDLVNEARVSSGG